MTTIQHEYGVTWDLSNRCMADLYNKISLDRPGAANGVLHIDETPLRINKSVAELKYGEDFYSSKTFRLPDVLQRVFDRYQFELIDESKAFAGVLLGKHGQRMLIRYLKSQTVEYEA